MIIGIEAAHANKNKRGGVENVCYYFINVLKNIIPQEHEVRLYATQPLIAGLQDLPDSWQARILTWPLKKLWSQLRLSWELFINPPDIFFTPGQLIPFFVPRHTVVLVHDSAFIRHPEAYGLLSRTYLRFMNRQIIKKAEIILVTAEFNAQELIDIYHIAKEKVVVVPLSYDADMFNQQSEEKMQRVLSEYDISKPYLLSVGRLETKKNTGFLIKAWEELRSEGVKIDLVLVGEYGKGQTSKAVKLAVKNSSFISDLKIIKYLPLEDLPVFYAGAKIFLFPSIYEGFGLPILEAMACGCPVIGSSVSAIPEVGGEAISTFAVGDLVDFKKQIKNLLENSDFREQKIEAGLLRVKQFSWLESGRKIWCVFEQMLPKS